MYFPADTCTELRGNDFLKKSNKRRRSNIYIYIYICNFPYQSLLQPRNRVHSINRQAYSALIQVRFFWYTRPMHFYNSPLHFIYHFTLSVDRHHHRHLSWLWHCRNDYGDTVEIVVTIYTVSRWSIVVHRLLWGRWVLADRRLRSYLNQIVENLIANGVGVSYY